MNKPTCKIFETPQDVAIYIAEELKSLSESAKSRGAPAHVSLSGGSTPVPLFTLLAEKYSNTVSWEGLHFWWGDERCVPPEHEESNFGVVKTTLLDHITMPAENVHRMIGEAEPEAEARRYRSELLEMVPLNAEGAPLFDWHILGMGGDGHTASLFPRDLPLDYRALTLAAKHPDSGQNRVSLGAAALCGARRTSVMVTEGAKAETLSLIMKHDTAAQSFPVYHIMERALAPEWILDKAAAALIQHT